MLCKMGDELTTALEKLAQLLVAKNADSTSTDGGVARVPQAEVVMELMPNEVKLEGMSNYLSWSRRALLILRTKGILGTFREALLNQRIRRVQIGRNEV